MKVYSYGRFQDVVIYVLILLTVLGWIGICQRSVQAEDVENLAKQARSAISASQRAMFSRKFEEAQEQLNKAADLIQQIKTADPEYSQLTTLENQYQKQLKDLEKRLPKKEAAEPTPQPADSAGTEAAQDLDALTRQANNALSASQRAMFNRKFEDAQAELNKAAELIAQIKAADSAFSQLNSLESKYERQKTDLEKRLPKQETSPPSASETQPASSETQTAKLPSNVLHYLEQVDLTITQNEQTFERELIGSPDAYIGNLESALKQVNETMDRIFKTYDDKFDHEHPDVKARQEKIAEFQAKIEEFKAKIAAQQAQDAETETQRKAQSKEWLQKIKPYITGVGQSGYDENTYLIGSGTGNVDELVHRKMIYAKAKVLFEEYQQIEFPDGKTQELEMAEEELARALKGFEEGYQESIDRFAAEAGEQLDYAEQWLTKQETKAQSAGEEKPLLLPRSMIQGIQKSIFALDAVTSGEDSRLQAFSERLAAIEQRGDNLRRLGVERTVMLPDAFGGPEIEELKTKAAEFLHKEYADAQVLRTSIISEDWTENQQWEYTDTMKSAVRYRITRSVTAQIAGKRGDEVFLYTLDISKDQQSDGSWSALYGHVMFIDPMLEENVNK